MNTCSVCNKEIISDSKYTTGYGIDSETGAKVCYACCGLQDSNYMRDHDRITLYLTVNHDHTSSYPRKLFKVTNWPGSLVFYPYDWSTGGHNWVGVRYDVWFKDKYGNQWWGVCYGKNTQLLHCKKLKAS